MAKSKSDTPINFTVNAPSVVTLTGKVTREGEGSLRIVHRPARARATVRVDRVIPVSQIVFATGVDSKDEGSIAYLDPNSEIDTFTAVAAKLVNGPNPLYEITDEDGGTVLIPARFVGTAESDRTDTGEAPAKPKAKAAKTEKEPKVKPKKGKDKKGKKSEVPESW